MNFADKVKKLAEEAPAARTGGINVNFGPMTVTPIVVIWHGRRTRPTKMSMAEYMEEKGIDDVDDVELDPGKESFQLHFDIDVSALNPSLNFHYERDVAIVASNRERAGKEVLTSWSEIVEPGLVAVFGKDWHKKLIAEDGAESPVFWVAAENVDALEPVKEGKKNYGVPKLIAKYKNEAECRKARDERYPPRNEEEEMAFGPEDEEKEGEFDEETLDQVRELHKSTRKNKKQTINMLKSKPFGDFDPEELFAAAIQE